MGSGNDFVIQVKGNRKALKQSIQQGIQKEQYKSETETREEQKGRIENRRYRVYSAENMKFPKGWKHIHSVIHVTRYGQRQGKSYNETALYISNLKESAVFFW